MTTRITLLLFAFAAQGLHGQNENVKVPDSLYWLRLPDNPEDFADSVAAGTKTASDFFQVGCPSASPWAAAALTALEGRAETDITMRAWLADGLDVMPFHDCPASDMERAEDWAVRWIDTEYASGAWFTVTYRYNAGEQLMGLLDNYLQSPRAVELRNKIANDTCVHRWIRAMAGHAPSRMIEPPIVWDTVAAARHDEDCRNRANQPA